jgi:outer membrane cobalamin receptor
VRASLLRPFPLIVFCVLFLARPAFAGPITGQVVDPQGRGVPDVDVLILVKGGATIVARTSTDSSGRFSLVVPDDASYELRVARDGFRAAPVAIANPTDARDLGTIPLEISAVSESLVVSAAQVEIPLSTTSSSVTVLTGEDLARRQVESVGDALRTVPGLTVVSNGARRSLTSVFPRGGDSNFSLVFVDGIEANTFGGDYDFAHLPIVNIDRIEIVRGPQSALYGSNAIGAVIRIITRRGGAPAGSASIEGGSLGTSRLAAATSGESGGWRWGASAERLATDNHNGETTAAGETVVNDDYERHSVAAGGGWRHDKGGLVRGDVRYSQDEMGSPGPFGSNPGGTYGGIDPISRGTNDRWLMSAGGTIPLNTVRVNADATHSRLDFAFVSPSFIDGSPDTVESFSRRTTGRVQADMTLAPGLELSAGTELLRESAGSGFIRQADGSTVPVERGQAGFFGEGRWNRGARLFVTAGLRVERISRDALAGNGSSRPPFDEDTVVSTNPRLAAAWYITSANGVFTKVRGSVGTGIRPPDAFEIAFTNNPSLKPERSKSADFGLDQALLRGLVLVETTAFFNRYDDLIVAVGSFSGSSRFTTDNISNARSRGLEIATTARVPAGGTRSPGVQIRFAYTLLDTEILAVDDDTGAPTPFEPGDRLLRRPMHQFSTDVLVDAGPFSAFVQGGGRTTTLDVDPAFGTFGGLFDAPGYSSWNIGAAWKIQRHFELFGRITNLFDKSYEEAFGFPALGRSAIAGLRVAAGR